MASVFFKRALLPSGWSSGVRLNFDEGRIASVEQGAQAQPGDDIAAIGLPGIANLHSHAFQRGMAGLAEIRGAASDSFWTWREVMYRFVGAMTPDDIEAIAAQAYVEMLETGFTRVGEFHYLHHDIGGAPFANIAENAERIAAAANATGIGLTLLPVFYAHGGFGKRAPGAEQGRFINDVARFEKLFAASRAAVSGLPGSIIGVAPHSLRAAAADELDQVIALAPDGPIHIHVAEQTKEVDDCLAFSGARPVQWLLSNQNVDARWCLIHATHMTAEETNAVAKSGAVTGLCPITEANLGDGVFDGGRYLSKGGRFGVGSDSNVLISLPEELRMLEYSQRLALRSRNVLSCGPGASTGRTLFDSALVGGNQALGQRIAGFVTGGAADMIALDDENLAYYGREDDRLLDAFVFAAGDKGIETVWSSGVKVVSNGRHRHRDVIGRRFRTVMQRLLAL
jgi:formimidoylglutamate deiminase